MSQFDHKDLNENLEVNFKSLNNQDLLTKIKMLANEDRKLQVLFLKHLKEVEKRKLFLEISYSSLFEYVVKELGYSESTAYRRIEAARLLNEMPEIEEKLKSGSLSLNTAAQVQTYFKKIKKHNVKSIYETPAPNIHNLSSNDTSNSDLISNIHSQSDISEKTASFETPHFFSPLHKAELISHLENKSSREVERHLLSLTPEPLLPKEKIKPLTAEHTELKLILNEDQKQRLDQLKLLLSHINPNMSYQELIDHLCQRTLKQLNPQLKKEKTLNKIQNLRKKEFDSFSSMKQNYDTQKENFRTAPDLQENSLKTKPNLLKNSSKIKPSTRVSRHLLSALKVKIHQRDQGCCSYVSPQTGKKCGSQFQVQIDHIHPYALGGKNEENNLRLLCAAHNRFRAEKTFGNRLFK